MIATGRKDLAHWHFQGVGLSTNSLLNYKAYGVPAHAVEGMWREGYIVNPIKPAD